MTRRAILIESSKTKHGDLPGARADVEKYSSFFQENEGGAWESVDIEKLHTPRKRDVIAALDRAKYVDYAFISFSGHGRHLVGHELFETMMILNDTEEMAVQDLSAYCDKQTLVVDACRNVVIVEEEERALFAFAMVRRAKSLDSSIRKLYREAFDNAIKSAEKGKIVMYSCDITESAGESTNGGYYSRNLVGCARAWAGGYFSSGMYSTRDAHYCASEATTALERSQQPQYQPGRRINHFPFAVKA